MNVDRRVRGSRYAMAAALGLAMAALPGAATAAAPSHTVLVGGSPAGGPVTYQAQAGTVSRSVSALELGCESSSAVASVQPGPTDGPLGSLKNVELRDCLGPLDVPMDADASGGDWRLRLSGPSDAGRVPVVIEGASIRFSNKDGLCSYLVSGELLGHLDTVEQRLNVTGPSIMFASDVQDCFFLVNEGDAAEFQMSYQLSGAPELSVID